MTTNERNAMPEQLRKNSRADGAGMRRLTELELHGYAGIEGEPNEARIGEVRLHGEITAEVVLCDSALGFYYFGPNDEQRGWQLNAPRLVLELVAVEVMTWATRFGSDALTEETLAAFGFERVV
jgi:hypothetical protein